MRGVQSMQVLATGHTGGGKESMGNHFEWNFEIGRVNHRMAKAHAEDVNYKWITSHSQSFLS
jgi:hypothetical protein